MFARRQRGRLDEAALHGVHHGFQAIVGTLFLVDAVQMISQRGQRDTQVTGDLGEVFGFRE